MADPAHHSIGEVLSLLKGEYADVTISKIRFLESQGLIEPERTPSGYRKFYDADIERLRWILAQQRDNFLPLKVIKRRLAAAGFDPASDPPARDLGPLPEPTLFARRDDGPAAPLVIDDDATVDLREPGVVPDETDKEAVAMAVERNSAKPVPVADGDPLSTPSGSVSMSAGELAAAVGCELALLGELEKLGLIASMPTDTGAVFDHEALVVSKAAVELQSRGLQPRHLRMFKVAADREAGALQQLVGPFMKRGGEAEVNARAELNELVRLGETIHRSILRRSFGTSPE